MARPLGSTLSADRGAPPSLFERFSATISLSDFPPPCIAVVLLSDSQRGPWGHPPGVRGGISRLPCKQLPYVHRVSGPRGGGIVLAISERFHVAFRSYDYVGPPKSFSFRGSIPGPHVPLSMLRLHSYEYTRMTRGQHGSLLLSCERLSLSATHRFAPAHRKVKYESRTFPFSGKLFDGPGQGIGLQPGPIEIEVVRLQQDESRLDGFPHGAAHPAVVGKRLGPLRVAFGVFPDLLG